MTEFDVKYITRLIEAKLIQSPCLEIGVGFEEWDNKKHLTASGIEYFGADMIKGPDVDYVIDFESDNSIIEKVFSGRRFNTVVAFSVLEHTFEPIKVMDNIISILNPGGICIIVAPSVWPIHNCPIDTYRFSPNFFEKYCQSRSLYLNREYFEFLRYGKVDLYKDPYDGYRYPACAKSAFHLKWSRVIHRLFNTSGRGVAFQSYIAMGVVIRK